ncbi:unnamed protein product [Lactuca virosa]|uniref:BHLH domain-containing protein n=1 Tax=Lactuca virosa TaxID=75947 RepID=A0AAU9LKL9_9ASTR|nr:unnamed protein product [Lactuca virosa]
MNMTSDDERKATSLVITSFLHLLPLDNDMPDAPFCFWLSLFKPTWGNMKKPERKVTEKIRRNQMKFLYSRLFSLIPPHLISKGGDQVSDRVDRTIEYIQSLKSSLEMSQIRKEQLLSTKKRSHENTNSNKSKSIDIQIHEMSPDLDYSSEVALANFSSSGHSTFHVRHKKIETEEMSQRLMILLQGYSNVKELGNDQGFSNELELGNDYASSCDQFESNLNIWDFDFQSNVWGWELEGLPMSITS